MMYKSDWYGLNISLVREFISLWIKIDKTVPEFGSFGPKLWHHLDQSGAEALQ